LTDLFAGLPPVGACLLDIGCGGGETNALQLLDQGRQGRRLVSGLALYLASDLLPSGGRIVALRDVAEVNRCRLARRFERNRRTRTKRYAALLTGYSVLGEEVLTSGGRDTDC
jgi:hypothetical protein